MAGQSSKLKILYLMKIFMEKTDEEHYITMSDIFISHSIIIIYIVCINIRYFIIRNIITTSSR